MNIKQFRVFAKRTVAGNKVVYKNGRFFLRVRCAKKAKPRCNYVLTGKRFLNAKGKKLRRTVRATRTKRAWSKANGKVKRIAIRVLPRERNFIKKKIRNRYRVAFKVRFKAKGRAVTFTKKFRVVIRR